MLANVQLTSKRQTNINVRHNVYLSKDKWIFQGDWRLLFFTQPTYGLGIQDFPAVFSLNGASLKDDIVAQSMNFNYLRLYETAFRRISGNLYAGIGFFVDHHWNIDDQRLNLDSAQFFITSHYFYSILENFPIRGYTANGLMIRALYDDRDNSINSFNGIYIDAGIRLNTTWLGSNRQSTKLMLELRKYLNLLNDQQHLAFWLMGDFLLSGTMPYLALPSLGWDTYNRSGRGYIQGRFRGQNMVYAETEYRFQLNPSGFLGGVVFLNALTMDNKFIDQRLFDNFAVGYGIGLRIKMNKETRTNVCVDLGIGARGSSGIYFGIQEAF
jgi:outer membrane protein assembly factor BamA